MSLIKDPDRDGQWLEKVVGLVMLALVFGLSVLYVRAGFSAYASFKFTLSDYGRYVNTIWNCAHGDPFRLLNGFSYLNTHLSFSLYLLAPAFLIWDHPFSLWIYQLVLLLAGLAIMARAAGRSQVPGPVVAAFLFFFLLNPFTQTVVLSEFHGVNLYLFLVPLLYYALLFEKRLVWLPLLLTCGVREEAAFLVIPMILYFAVRDKWKGGFVYSGLCALYGLFACTILFRWINGFVLTKQRPDISPDRFSSLLARGSLADRLLPLSRLLLPVFPFLPRGWLPILVFPLVPLLFTVLSPYPAQYGLKYHYPAAPLIFVVLALLHAIILSWQGREKRMGLLGWGQVFFLVAFALVSHARYGLLPGGRFSLPEYQHASIIGESAICVASQVPKSGLLLTDRKHAGLVANRRDLIIWDLYTPQGPQPDIILVTRRDALGRYAEPINRFLETGRFGIVFDNGEYLILSRGAGRESGQGSRKRLRRADRVLRFAYMRKKAGQEVLADDCRIVRYWSGSGERSTPVLVAYGRTLLLPAGEYRVRFRLRSACDNRGRCGQLRVVERKTQKILARARVVPGMRYHWQTFGLRVDGETRIEPQVLGENGRLWLDQVEVTESRADEMPEQGDQYHD